MKLDLRYACVVGLAALGVLAPSSAAEAQARKRRPQQGATGAEDAAAARADAAAQRRERQLEQELDVMTSRSDKGLRIVRHANGTETVHLQGRFMSVALATVDEDGGQSATCQVGPEAVREARAKTRTTRATARPKAGSKAKKTTATAEEK